MDYKKLVLILIIMIFFSSCEEKELDNENKEKSYAVLDTYVKIKPSEASPMKVLLIIAQSGFQDVEYNTTRKVLEDNGVYVEVASITTETATGKYGMTLQPDLAVKDVNLSRFNMIALIGGPGAPELAEYSEVMELLEQANNQEMYIGAICIAPTILAKAGILEKKKATVWSSMLNKESIRILEENGATYVDEPVVKDGRIITANGPDAAEEFGKGIVEMIS
jgi:protease I